MNARMLDENRKKAAKQNWLTHPRELEPIRNFLGRIDLDPCPHPKSFVEASYCIHPPQSTFYYTPTGEERSPASVQPFFRSMVTTLMDGRGSYYNGLHWSWRGWRAPQYGTKVFANIPYDRSSIHKWSRHIAGDWSDFRHGLTAREAACERARLYRQALQQEPWCSSPGDKKRALYERSPLDELVLLVQASVGCVWFQDIIAPVMSAALIARGRWTFVDPETVRRDGTFEESQSAVFDSMLVYIGNRPDAFKKSFQNLGMTI